MTQGHFLHLQPGERRPLLWRSNGACLMRSGIVDQVVSMHLFARDAEGGWVLDETATDRRLVCTSGNPWGLPAKDRSGRLDLTEPPDLGALLTRIDGRAPHQPAFAS